MPKLNLSSPDGTVTVTIVETDGRLSYSVDHIGRSALAPSQLGLIRADTSFERVAVDGVSETTLVRDRYRLTSGKQLDHDVTYRTATVSGTNAAGRHILIEARAYNDGIAFRYVFPEHDETEYTVLEELTTFAIAGDGRAWIQPHDVPALATPAYEAEYADGIAIGTPTALPSWNFPALFALADLWILITEADLHPDYFGGHLSAAPVGNEYRLVMPHPEEGDGVGAAEPSGTLPWTTPWRVVVVGDLATIVQTHLVTHLAEPSRLDDTGWIRPGRVSWSWWSDHTSPGNLDTLRSYVDLAAELGWEHSLVDANWDVHSDAEMMGLVSYADERDVGIWLWYNSAGPNNRVPEGPRDRMAEPGRRRAEFARLSGWGVAGVKVDFFHSDKPTGIGLMWDIIEDAAAHDIMVNLHGCTIPRGWRRTWPHLLTMEGVRGAEQYGFAPEFPKAAVWHNTILPYTRNVVGPMDYTPVTFTDVLYPHRTTAGHELALAVAYESGLLHYADRSSAYLSLLPEARQMLEQAPAIWEESRFIGGFPGQYFVIARRSGGTWWIAGINGEGSERRVTIDPADLAPNLEALVVTDGPAGLEASRPTGILTVPMATAGGFLARLRPGG